MARVDYVALSGSSDVDSVLPSVPNNYFRALASHPDSMRVFMPVHKWIRFKMALPARVREVAFLEVAAVSNCRFAIAHHLALARELGVLSDAEIAYILGRHPKTGDQGRAEESLTLLEHQVLAFARSITVDLSVSDEVWAAIREGLGADQAMELLLLCSFYNHVVRVMRALEIGLEPEFEDTLHRFELDNGLTATGS